MKVKSTIINYSHEDTSIVSGCLHVKELELVPKRTCVRFCLGSAAKRSLVLPR